MRIGILSRWNATCGVSLHAELIGRELQSRGHSICVFAPLKQSASKWWHHRIVKEDESYVLRVYTELSPAGEKGYLNPEDIISENLDILIVESYEKLPYEDVEKLVLTLRKREIPSIAVIHEGRHSDLGYTTLDIFEIVFVFDDRFINEVVKNKVSKAKVKILPYPCIPVSEGSRKFAEDGTVVFFSFGRQPPEEYEDYIYALRDLKREFPQLLYRIVRASDPLPVSDDWIVQEKKILDTKEIYSFLHKADIHLLPKGKTNRVVVSSTLFQTLGSMCITVAPQSRFFESLPQGDFSPLLLYKNVTDLKEKIKALIENPDLREKIKRQARLFVEENSVERVTNKLLRFLPSKT